MKELKMNWFESAHLLSVYAVPWLCCSHKDDCDLQARREEAII